MYDVSGSCVHLHHLARKSFGSVNHVRLVPNRPNDAGGGGNSQHKGYGFLYMLDDQGDTAVDRYAAANGHKIEMLDRKGVQLQRHDKCRSGERHRSARGGDSARIYPPSITDVPPLPSYQLSEPHQTQGALYYAQSHIQQTQRQQPPQQQYDTTYNQVHAGADPRVTEYSVPVDGADTPLSSSYQPQHGAYHDQQTTDQQHSGNYHQGHDQDRIAHHYMRLQHYQTHQPQQPQQQHIGMPQHQHQPQWRQNHVTYSQGFQHQEGYNHVYQGGDQYAQQKQRLSNSTYFQGQTNSSNYDDGYAYQQAPQPLQNAPLNHDQQLGGYGETLFQRQDIPRPRAGIHSTSRMDARDGVFLGGGGGSERVVAPRRSDGGTGPAGDRSTASVVVSNIPQGIAPTEVYRLVANFPAPLGSIAPTLRPDRCTLDGRNNARVSFIDGRDADHLVNMGKKGYVKLNGVRLRVMMDYSPPPPPPQLHAVRPMPLPLPPCEDGRRGYRREQGDRGSSRGGSSGRGGRDRMGRGGGVVLGGRIGGRGYRPY